MQQYSGNLFHTQGKKLCIIASLHRLYTLLWVVLDILGLVYVTYERSICLCLCLCCRSYIDMLQRVRELCRYLPGLEGDTKLRYCSQVVICTALVLFRSAFLYVSSVQPALFQGQPLSFHAHTVHFF